MDASLTLAMANATRVADLTKWLTQAGLDERPHVELLESYCLKLVELGVPLMRFHVTQRTIHPSYGGIGFNWKREEGPERQEYEHTDVVPENWLSSPFHHMFMSGIYELRERITPDQESRFPVLNEMRDLGATDYFAVAVDFSGTFERADKDSTDIPDGAVMSWTSDGETGFSEVDLALLQATYRLLGLVVKTHSSREISNNLLGIYLGRDAGRRVMSGEIQRGSSHWIDAVICYFDLEGFTSMSQKIPGKDLIALLNEYFGLVVNKIEDNGGNVLKFMGDGLLAIFDREQLPDAPLRALKTVQRLREGMSALSAARKEAGGETMGYTMALHAGKVLYGNMGSDSRLDFTVIGPEVNVTARLSGMHRPLGQQIVVSEAVARDVPEEGFELVSLGRYMLRGVEHPQELFTIYDPN